MQYISLSNNEIYRCIDLKIPASSPDSGPVQYRSNCQVNIRYVIYDRMDVKRSSVPGGVRGRGRARGETGRRVRKPMRHRALTLFSGLTTFRGSTRGACSSGG